MVVVPFPSHDLTRMALRMPGNMRRQRNSCRRLRVVGEVEVPSLVDVFAICGRTSFPWAVGVVVLKKSDILYK